MNVYFSGTGKTVDASGVTLAATVEDYLKAGDGNVYSTIGQIKRVILEVKMCTYTMPSFFKHVRLVCLMLREA